ncbi:SLATT domain-containing protein [Nocardiopsis alba]|uniref:SLATT domain-containing protein n=1 Tax=Nocardiopsis alba TaxID=53437 RepID=UPI003D7154C7
MEENPTVLTENQKRELIKTNSNIILIKNYIEAARRRSYYGVAFWTIGILAISAIFIDILIFQWQGIAPYFKHAITLGSLASIGLGAYISSTPGVLYSSFPSDLTDVLKLKSIGSPRRTIAQLELELQLLREEKKHTQETVGFSIERNRASYKEDAFVYIEELRRESNFYRRVSNFFQMIIIAGASISTLGAGTSYFVNQISIGVAIASFCIAVASSMTGYFKYKERSFYSQQTADAVEHEIEAFELGVGRYKAFPVDDPDGKKKSLEAFAQELHRLRQDQKMREQNLDQPSSKGEEGGN